MAEPQPVTPSLPELIFSLEQATHMAKQLPSTTDPTHLLQIYSSLSQTHNHLSAFLSRTQLPHPMFAPAENSLSSATGAAGDENGDEPMQVGDEDDDGVEQVNSRGTIDRVEEKMRDCFIKNKRPKRPLSPSAAEERRFSNGGIAGGGEGFDPYATRLKALDLIYQFHG
ncbi:hypothetical protein UlMin_028664 [Ulmus minor]